MTVAFGATLIYGPIILGPGLKVASYKVQMPEVSVEAGHALDLSADFTYVYAGVFGPSGAVGDFGYLYGLIGTYAATGVAAAGLSVVHHWTTNGAAAFPVVTAGTDIKAVDDLILTVFGA
jgi:hypothetical protein